MIEVPSKYRPTTAADRALTGLLNMVSSPERSPEQRSSDFERLAKRLYQPIPGYPQFRIGFLSYMIGTNISSVTFEQGFKEQYQDLVVSNKLPICASRHVSHLDGVLLGTTTNRMSSWAKERGLGEQRFILPVARSMPLGYQGVPLQFYYHFLGEQAKPLGIVMGPVTRPTDIKEYPKLRGSRNDDYYQKLALANGVVLLPEGTVQGGAESGGEVRLQLEAWKKNKSPVAQHYFKLKESGREPFLVPMSIEGSQLIHNRRMRASSILGLINPFDRPVQIRVGLPISGSSIPEASFNLRSPDLHPIDQLMADEILRLTRELKAVA